MNLTYINNDYFKFLFIPIIILTIYFLNPLNIFVNGNELTFVSVIVSCFTIEYFIQKAKNGQSIYMRPIPAMKAMEEAVGRATEMGKPVFRRIFFHVYSCSNAKGNGCEERNLARI